nr:MAG TPA: hypothetical protein [Bacteriophage sp.]
MSIMCLFIKSSHNRFFYVFFFFFFQYEIK